jgi:hypothetical protein
VGHLGFLNKGPQSITCQPIRDWEPNIWDIVGDRKVKETEDNYITSSSTLERRGAVFLRI